MTRSKAMEKARQLSSVSVLDFYAWEGVGGIWDATSIKPLESYYLQYFIYRNGEQIK